MELSEFIKNVILEIIQGIKITQEEINNKKITSIVNPTWSQQRRGDLKGSIYEHNTTTDIELEASIITSNEKSAGASIKVVSGDLKNKNETSSKVKFTIPLLLPPSELPDDFNNYSTDKT